jgi:hypothetical protein
MRWYWTFVPKDRLDEDDGESLDERKRGATCGCEAHEKPRKEERQEKEGRAALSFLVSVWTNSVVSSLFADRVNVFSRVDVVRLRHNRL